MSKKQLPEYLNFASELQFAGLAVNPSELHGLLTGMLSGGMNFSDKSWQPLVFDYVSEGMAWPSNVLSITQVMLDKTSDDLTQTSLELALFLPDEEAGATLFDVADGLADWVNHFISGLGLIGASLTKASKDTKEALADLEEIAKLGIDEDDDMQEQGDLLEQVIEHAKACVLIIHAEFGQKIMPSPPSPTIH
ncbi:YecA family protein [Vibrio caribbeanicus]|uniref:YecA/YgfB family protein n=1 Tax=Vibrio caribbeanicus TaxID=701175 RepID=UPI002284E31F|nr:YecA family protein [Vibrio caribbeanicus]MCY9844970.1 YecA family protein [Vibrio caribbeanicus]